MVVIPDTEIRLVKVPLTLDNKNQITFTNTSAQYNYFNSLPHISMENCSYQRKEEIIRYEAHLDDIMEYNYVMYKNKHYKDKWFYAFITGMEYDSDYMVLINIETDVFQTWQFDLIYKACFVEREMMSVSEDVPRCQFIT